MQPLRLVYTRYQMDASNYLDTVRREGELSLAAARRTSLDAPIPTCPGWDVRFLLRHLGSIHRWVTTIIEEARQEPPPSLEAECGPWPNDGELLDWFRAGYTEMVRALEEAPPDLTVWSFFPSLPSIPFWARRQAHENGIHRADLEAAAGGPITPFDPTIAADGIDELLVLLASGPGRGLRTDSPRILQVHAADVDRGWFIHAAPDGSSVSSEPVASDGTVSGPASDLYLLLWNRRSTERLDVSGDVGLLDRWRDSVHI